MHALAYNLGNFMRMLAMPKAAAPWSLTSLREKLIKIGAKVVSHGGYVTFQLAEVAVPPQMFQDILRLIARLRVPPAPDERGQDRYRPRPTRGVHLEERKAPSSSAIRATIHRFGGLSCPWHSSFVATDLKRADNRAPPRGNPGNVG